MSFYHDKQDPPFDSKKNSWIAAPGRGEIANVRGGLTTRCGKAYTGSFMSNYQFAVSTSEMRSEEHTSELQSLMRISYAVFCLKKQKQQMHKIKHQQHTHI